jgi:hypothetical protein
MNRRANTIKVTLSDRELARLDESRGTTTRAAHLRRLVYEPPGEAEIATRCELLSRAARSGSVTAAIALVRTLRPEDEDRDEVGEALDRILNRERGWGPQSAGWLAVRRTPVCLKVNECWTLGAAPTRDAQKAREGRL